MTPIHKAHISDRAPSRRLRAPALVLVPIVIASVIAMLVSNGALDAARTEFRVWTLDRLGPDDEQAVVHVLDDLEASDVGVRRAAAQALGRIGLRSEEAVAALGDRLDNDVWTVAAAAAWSLGQLGPDENAVLALVRGLGHTHREVRRYSGFALAQPGFDAEQVREPLVAMLSDATPMNVATAARALGYLSDDQTTSPLLTVLNHPSWVVRADVAVALRHGKHQLTDEQQANLQVVIDSDPRVRDAVARAARAL